MKRKIFVGTITLVIVGLLMTSTLSIGKLTQMPSEKINNNSTTVERDEKSRSPAPTQVVDITPWHTDSHDLYNGLGEVGKAYTYMSTSNESGSDLYFTFYWGIGNSTIVGPVTDGGPAIASHIYYITGMFDITVTVQHGPDGVPSDPSPARQVRMCILSDCNFDGVFDYDDISYFVWTITLMDKVSYYNWYPTGYFYIADINLDNNVNFRDINPFFALINNHPPETPQTPVGPTKGIVNSSYTYSTSATDSDAARKDKILYIWHWGDLGPNETTDYYESGVTIFRSHSWQNAGVYSILVKAKDRADGYSDWSAPLQVRMYKLGDANGDDLVNFKDIGPFVLMLSSGETAYYNVYPNGYWYTGDINQDGQVNFKDINPFVTLLSTGHYP